MVKEMGEWLMVQGPGIESQWETVALYWYQSVCLSGLPCAVQQHGVGGKAGHGEKGFSDQSGLCPAEERVAGSHPPNSSQYLFFFLFSFFLSV